MSRRLVTAASSATETSASTTAAAATVLARLGFVHLDVPAVALGAVQRGNSGLSLVIVAHLDKTKTLAPTGVPIHDNLGAVNSAVRAEKLLQRSVRYVVAKITNIQILTHDSLQEWVDDPPSILRII